MFPHLWLLAVLAPLALGVPVPRESVTPSVRVSDSISKTKTSNGRDHLGLNRADKTFYHLKGEGVKAGSKTISIDKGSPSLGGYSAHGTGISYSLSTGIPGKTSGETAKGNTGGVSRRSSHEKSDGLSDGGTSKRLKGRRSHRGHGEHDDDMGGGKMQEPLESHTSGTRSGGASKAGSDGMTTGSGGTFMGTAAGSEDSTGTTGTTTDSKSTVDSTTTGGERMTREERTTGGDRITTSTSKHK